MDPLDFLLLVFLKTMSEIQTETMLTPFLTDLTPQSNLSVSFYSGWIKRMFPLFPVLMLSSAVCLFKLDIYHTDITVIPIFSFNLQKESECVYILKYLFKLPSTLLSTQWIKQNVAPLWACYLTPVKTCTLRYFFTSWVFWEATFSLLKNFSGIVPLLLDEIDD